ncbi:hypothetical protein [Kitasatospora griseola]|uniref:hypothetical protein n=1 Tax=Kitasatospora griseola TaxID=2064 RepID=UPI0019A0B266|nr:hypothetical protein [Kitasatospora griseola]GGQ84836.1 hypothetical protein GCM10010195_45760 [Kitasatospora griseola]
MNRLNEGGKTRHLVLHDYGMGGLWWWVWAGSAEEIVEACAEVEVVTEPDLVKRVETWNVAEIHLDDPEPNPLTSFRAKRDAQRGQPGFGALVGRDRVHLRSPEGEDGEVYLDELGPDGRRVRQIELRADGDAIRTTAEDWLFNPPSDLYDPQYAALEIGRDEFEDAWRRARREPAE